MKHFHILVIASLIAVICVYALTSIETTTTTDKIQVNGLLRVEYVQPHEEERPRLGAYSCPSYNALTGGWKGSRTENITIPAIYRLHLIENDGQIRSCQISKEEFNQINETLNFYNNATASIYTKRTKTLLLGKTLSTTEEQIISNLTLEE